MKDGLGSVAVIMAQMTQAAIPGHKRTPLELKTETTDREKSIRTVITVPAGS
jgi:hypothetical protein